MIKIFKKDRTNINNFTPDDIHYMFELLLDKYNLKDVISVKQLASMVYFKYENKNSTTVKYTNEIPGLNLESLSKLANVINEADAVLVRCNLGEKKALKYLKELSEC